MPDNISKMYQELKGTYELGSENDFRKYLSDGKKREALRKELEADYEVGDSASFTKYLGIGEQPQPTERTEPAGVNPAARTGATGQLQEKQATSLSFQPSSRSEYVTRPESYTDSGALLRTMRRQDAKNAEIVDEALERSPIVQGQRRRNEPVVRTGTPADQSVIKTQGQWEDEVRQSAAKSAADLFGTGFNYEVGRVIDKATDAFYKRLENATRFTPGAGAIPQVYSFKRANEEIDPERLTRYLTDELQNRIGGWLQQDGKSEAIVDAAKKLGVSPEDYAEMVVNEVASQAQQKLYQKVKEGYMPKGTADYILNGLHDSLLGTMMDMATMTKGQRQMMGQANYEFSQKNREESHWGGTMTDLARGGVAFMGDAPVFSVLGKVAAPMVRGTGALLESVGVRTTMGMSEAAFERLGQTVLNNSSWLQRIKFGAGRAIAGSAYNFGLYEGTSNVVQDLSVGEDTSLGTLAGDFIEGFGKGSVKGAVLGTVSRPFQGVSPRFGVRSDMNWGQKVIVGTGKGALATGNIMAEGLGFTAGAYLVDEEARNRVKDSEKPWEVVLQDTMENTMMAGIFKLMSVHNLQDPVGSLKKAFEAPADSRFNFQRWQMKEIEEAYGGKGKFVSAIEQIARSADAERNTQMSRFYEDFMNRNDISWDTKNKVSAILTGNMATVPPIPSRISIDNDRNEVVAFGRRGEVLFRREFKTQEEADAIKAQLDMSREEQMLHNLIGTFLVKDEEGNVNPESQKQLDDTIAEVGYETALNKEGIINALNKAPEKRSEMEQYAIEELFGRLYEVRFPNNQPHPAQDHQNGRDIADETLNIDELDPAKNPNGVEPGKYDQLTQAYDEANKTLEAAFKNNDTFYQFVKEQRANGLGDGEIAIEARKMAFSEEESQALIDFERAKEQMDGYVELTGERIGEYVSNEVSGMSFKGELDGQEVKDRFVRVVDDEGNEYYLRTGKVTVGEDGRLVSTDGSGTVIVRDAQGKDKMVLADTMSMAPEDPSNPLRDDIAAYSEQRTTQLHEAISLAIDPKGKLSGADEPKSQGQLAYEQEQGDVEQNGGLVKNDLADQTLSESLRGSLHTLGRKIGKKIQVVTKEELKQINPLAPDNARGMRSADNKTLYLVSDYVKDNEYMQRFVTGHELTHSIKSESGDVKTWNAFVDAVRSHMGDKAFDEAVKRVEELYERSGIHLDREAAIEEVSSDWAGEHLTDDASIRHIVESVERAGKDPVTFTQRIKQLFEDMIAAITGSGRTLSKDEKAQLEKLTKARDLWEQMYNECVAKNEARGKAAESQRLAEQQVAEERKAREEKGVVFGADGEADYLRMTPEATIADLSEQAGPELAGSVIGTMLGNANKALKGIKDVKPASQKPSDVIAAAKETAARRKAAQDAVDYWKSVSERHKEMEKEAKEEAKRQAVEAARQQAEAERQERLKTPEGRAEEIAKANVADRPKVAQGIYGDAFNGDMTPNGVEEYVMAHFSGQIPNLGKGFIDTDSFEQETGHKVDGFGGDSKAYYPYLAGRGKGKSLAQVAEDIWHGMPEGLQSMTDDAAIKNMVIDLLTGAQKATDIRDALLNSRIAQAEKSLRAEQEFDEAQAGLEAPAPSNTFTEAQAGKLVAQMETQAEVAPELELTPANWTSQFGEDGKVSTPIGEVTMGENQYFKLAQQGREGKLGMVKPTLENPDVIIEEERPAKDGKQERPTSFVFVKAFTKADGSRYYYFTSVTVSKDGHEVVISNQEKSANRISRLLQQGNVTWINSKFSSHPNTRVGESVPVSESNMPTSTDNQPALLGINSPELSAGKGTEKSSTVQGKGKEFSERLEKAVKETLEEELKESPTDDKGEIDELEKYIRNEINGNDESDLYMEVEAYLRSLVGEENYDEYLRQVVNRERQEQVGHYLERFNVKALMDKDARADGTHDDDVDDPVYGFGYFGASIHKHGNEYDLWLKEKNHGGVWYNPYYTETYKNLTEKEADKLLGDMVERQTRRSANELTITGMIGEIEKIERKISEQGNPGINTADPLEAIERAADLFNGGGVSGDLPFASFEGDAPFSIDDGKGQGGASFSLVEDQAEIERLDKEKKIKVYRSVQLDKEGNARSPIASKLGRGSGKVETSGIIEGRWEKADEHPELADENGKIVLDKGEGNGTLTVAYNPYIHTSRSMINDQFASAWKRDNIVVIETEVPESELTAGYHADMAKDAVGEHEWKAGPVGRKLPEDRQRKVILSRWDKPVRTVSWEEVADDYARTLEGLDIEVPFNVVPKALLPLLVERGIKIGEPEKGNAGDAARQAYEAWKNGNSQYSLTSDPIEAVEQSAEQFRKEREEQRVKSFHDMIDDLFTNPDFDKSAHSRMHYDLGDTPEYMKKLGISGERFTMQFKNIKTHMGKDADHNLTAKEWHELPDAIKRPFLITTYGKNEGKFRLYTTVKVGDKFAVVGVDVVKVNKGKGVPMLELNRIKTVFGRDRYVFENGENILAYDENITPEQEALLRGHNFREYPSIQELSAGKDSKYSYSLQEKEEKSEEFNTSPMFYSNAQRAVEGIRQEKATAEQWLAMIQKAGGLKAGEDKWLGLSEWLTQRKTAGHGGSVTKQEVLEFIRANQVEVEEEGYTEHPQGFDELKREYDEWLRDGGYDYAHEQLVERFGDDADIAFGDLGGELVIDNGEAASALLGSEKPVNDIRRNYTTEGLENKREIALTVPTVEPYNESDDIHFGDAGGGRAVAWVRFGETEVEEPSEFDKRMREKYGSATPTARWTQEEWDEYSRQGPRERKRVLVIDEIQSKRHQDGRERGYDNFKRINEIKKRRKELNDKIRSGEDLTYAEHEELGSLAEEQKELMLSDGIPDAPFEKNWHELAMKRMLRYAAENGYDKVAWTTGEQQAERYELTKVIDEIAYWKEGDNYGISAGDASDSQKIDQQTFTPQELVETFGREIANKIINDEGVEESVLGYPEDSEVHYLNGQTIKVGGEGMKGFYDQILPRFMDKYGKKWGVKTGEVELPGVGGGAATMLQHTGQEGLTMHSVDVTPEMKASVLEGQPMFSLSDDPMEAISQAADAFRKERLTKRQRERIAFAERQWRRAHEVADDAIKKLNLSDNITVVDSIDELEGRENIPADKRNAKGWYDEDTDKIVVVMGNHRSPTDVLRTILREGVSRHGLRKLFGEGFETFLDNVYNNVHNTLHDEIDELAKKYDGDTKKGTEEYLGRLAEDTDFERAVNQGWWQQIKSAFLDMFRKIGLKGFAMKSATSDVSISDNELRYVLWRSYENLSEPGRYKMPEEDNDVRERLAQVVEMPVKGRIEDEIPMMVRNRSDELFIEKKVGEMSLNEAMEAYKRIDDSMRDENGLDLDEHFERTKRDWIAEHGIAGIGKQQADELQSAMDKYGSGMVELRWQLQERILQLGGSYGRGEGKYSLADEEKLNNQGKDTEKENKDVSLPKNKVRYGKTDIERVFSGNDAIARTLEETSDPGVRHSPAEEAGRGSGKKESVLGSLVQRAKANNVWVEDIQRDLAGKYIDSGQENQVSKVSHL